MNESQKKAMNMLQVAGYVADVNGVHPEMLFVRNVDHIDEQTGDYVGSNDQFEVTEDFWNRDCLTEDARAAFRGGGAWRYFNGFPHGRMAFHGLSTLFRHFQEQAWAHPEWRFRPPRTLDQLASFVELEIRAIATMFGCSEYDAPYVGGAVQVETVGPPVGGAML